MNFAGETTRTFTGETYVKTKKKSSNDNNKLKNK